MKVIQTKKTRNSKRILKHYNKIKHLKMIELTILKEINLLRPHISLVLAIDKIKYNIAVKKLRFGLIN
jgi:hypothetical protein